MRVRKAILLTGQYLFKTNKLHNIRKTLKSHF